MNTQYEKRLEQEIDRELKALPELTAPSSLAQRVMSSIQQKAEVPWYARSLMEWPVPLRVAAMLFLVALFGGLCVVVWQVRQAGAFGDAFQPVLSFVAQARTFLVAVGVLLQAVVLAAKHLGTAFLVACLAAVLMGYVFCLGLGSLWLRVAFAKR
jgi:hypothetical protein